MSWEYRVTPSAIWFAMASLANFVSETSTEQQWASRRPVLAKHRWARIRYLSPARYPLVTPPTLPKLLWKHHKSKEGEILHRSYVQKKNPNSEKNIFFSISKKFQKKMDEKIEIFEKSKNSKIRTFPKIQIVFANFRNFRKKSRKKSISRKNEKPYKKFHPTTFNTSAKVPKNA